jgi:uncharacterized protein with PIN domain
MEADPPTRQFKFCVDVMLGTLARWLRILGYDTSYNNQMSDEDLIECCVQENRVAVTRDRRLARRRALSNCLLIKGNSLGDQLREVLQFTGEPVQSELVFSRCLVCNLPLESVKRAEVQYRVPPYVYLTQKVFRRCRSCRRVYWQGTHKDRMMERLSVLLSRQEQNAL